MLITNTRFKPLPSKGFIAPSVEVLVVLVFWGLFLFFLPLCSCYLEVLCYLYSIYIKRNIYIINTFNTQGLERLRGMDLNLCWLPTLANT